MAPQLKIAAEYNQVGSLLTLYEIDADEFRRYMVGDPKTEWYDHEGIVFDGERHAHQISLPWFKWIISGISVAGAKVLRDAYCKGASAEVTVQTYNKTENDYFIYNAIMYPPEPNDQAWVYGGWSGYTITFINAQLYSGFSDGFTMTGFGVS